MIEFLVAAFLVVIVVGCLSVAVHDLLVGDA